MAPPNDQWWSHFSHDSINRGNLTSYYNTNNNIIVGIFHNILVIECGNALGPNALH